MALIDLHTHSSASLDGEIEPARLVAMARESGVTHFALTDHNRADGVEEALAAGRRLGVKVIPGIEIDCFFRDANLHLLGYGVDHRDRRYRELWEGHLAARALNNDKKVEAVRALGFYVDDAAVKTALRDGVLASIDIAAAVLADFRNAGHPELEPFRPGGALCDNPLVNFCWTYVTKGRPAHVDDGGPTLDEALDLVLSTGGVPVLAHPGSSIRGREDYLADILAAGVAGVEVYCGYHGPEEAARWREAALACGAFITCGSDFHGRAKPAIAIGVHGGDADEAFIMDVLFGGGGGLSAFA